MPTASRTVDRLAGDETGRRLVVDLPPVRGDRPLGATQCCRVSGLPGSPGTMGELGAGDRHGRNPISHLGGPADERLTDRVDACLLESLKPLAQVRKSTRQNITAMPFLTASRRSPRTLGGRFGPRFDPLRRSGQRRGLENQPSREGTGRSVTVRPQPVAGRGPRRRVWPQVPHWPRPRGGRFRKPVDVRFIFRHRERAGAVDQRPAGAQQAGGRRGRTSDLPAGTRESVRRHGAIESDRRRGGDASRSDAASRPPRQARRAPRTTSPALRVAGGSRPRDS